jgi:hypothetical protein
MGELRFSNDRNQIVRLMFFEYLDKQKAMGWHWGAGVI